MASKCSSGVNEELHFQLRDVKFQMREGTCPRAKHHMRNVSSLIRASRCVPPRNLARHIGKVKRAVMAKCGKISSLAGGRRR